MTINLDGETLNLERRPDDGKLFVSGIQIVAKDVIGVNGIIHVIDGIIMPDSGKYDHSQQLFSLVGIRVDRVSN